MQDKQIEKYALNAIVDAYLVLDYDISLDYQLVPLCFPVHLVGRLQDTWKAPFSI